ncbi:MAG: DUF2950 domain-containing protein [Gammaproteobacteria bacterium]|nr:DUF2950 domain-containing protein [Gammaproteobacteria bacterium]MDH3413027.1 DUF2950 domain-containing protein [Gammaproteobacteria bacterium]
MFPTNATVSVLRSVALAAIGALILTVPARAAESKTQAPEAKQKPSAARQKTFPAPEEAAQELVAAAKAGDSRALLAILGPEAIQIVSSGDAVADEQGRERFVKAYEEANKLEKSGDARVVLSVGKDAWPFPIPIVKEATGWRFDTMAGKEEILNRRIGRNEISAMQAMLAYVDAQREYYLANPQKEKLLQYAQRFISTKGKRDGLYFPTTAQERPSPLGPLFDSARAEGYAKGEKGKPTPYHGYHFRILKRQGPAAPDGTYDYVVDGTMIGGFALVAWPASYGNSGVMTFIVNHDGVVYEKDLGPETAEVVQQVTSYDPDKTWKRP